MFSALPIQTSNDKLQVIFRVCFFNARAVACLLYHEAYACPVTYATRTTPATVSVLHVNGIREVPKRPPGRVPIKTHNPRPSAGPLKKKRRREKMHRPVRTFFIHILTRRYVDWINVGRPVRNRLRWCKVWCTPICESVSTVIPLYWHVTRTILRRPWTHR